MMSPLAEWRQKRLLAAAARGTPGALATIDERTRARRQPDWVSGACLLVRRADAEAVGLLDERYFMYIEDVDFCAALRARGRRILFTPDVDGHAPARPLAAGRAGGHRPRPTATATWRSTTSTIRAGRRCCDAYLRLKGA